ARPSAKTSRVKLRAVRSLRAGRTTAELDFMELVLLLCRARHFELHYAHDLRRIVIGIRINNKHAVHAWLISDLKRERERAIRFNGGRTARHRPAIQRCN